MAFATLADLITRFGVTELAQLVDRAIPRVVTDDLLTAGVAGDFTGMTPAQQAAVQAGLAIANQALDDATETVKGYVATRYPGVLQATPVPMILNRLTCALARFELHADGAPDHIKDRAEKARATLRDISTGTLTLGETAEQGNTLSAGDGVEIVSTPARFKRENSTGFL